ncbi:MAG: TetR/AcrR family transcriptional regulator [Halieaceae bacterium]|nr:TetR/AcrR family transcriptional regulator [Halieaceae bacterium]
MQKNVGPSKSAPGSVASRAVDRAIERRRAAYEEEVMRLVEASFVVIQKTGNLEPRVNEIVAHAGLSNQAFYKHFQSKDELLLAVLDEGSRMLRSYLEHRMDKVKSPERKIHQWIDGMVEQVFNPEAAHATRPFALSRGRLSEQFPEEVRDSERQLTALLREAIKAAAIAGEIPAADPDRDSEIVYNTVMGWMVHKLSSSPPKKADVQHLMTFIIHGLRRGMEPK